MIDLNLPSEVKTALALTAKNLIRTGYTEREVDLAMVVFDTVMMNLTVNALVNEVDIGRTLGAFCELIKALDQKADQDTAAALGIPGKSGKN